MVRANLQWLEGGETQRFVPARQAAPRASAPILPLWRVRRQAAALQRGLSGARLWLCERDCGLVDHKAGDAEDYSGRG
jgi:hypothetical protein